METFSPSTTGAWREYTPLEKIPCVVKLHPPPSKIAPYVVHPLWDLGAWESVDIFRGEIVLKFCQGKGVGVIDTYYTKDPAAWHIKLKEMYQ